MGTAVLDLGLRVFAQSAVANMANFVRETKIYQEFPTTKLDVESDTMPGCAGGAIYVDKIPTPYVRICSRSILVYTLDGFPEYDHICNDKEIGSLLAPFNWKHCLTVVLCHEMAHAVRMMQLIKDIQFTVPETFASYPIDAIRIEMEHERASHDRPWQFVYRNLRNEFANNKDESEWVL